MEGHWQLALKGMAAEPVIVKEVPSTLQGQERLDRFLASVLEISRSQVKRLIEEGFVSVNGKEAKASSKVKRGDVIRVSLPPPSPPRLEPEPMELEVLYEDDELMVIAKPPGLVVQPGAGHPSGTLVNALLARCPTLLSVGGGQRAGLVHRLDKDTSGVIVIAKTDRAHALLAAQFKERTVHKEYLALVYGVMPKEKGVVELPLGRDRKDPKKISSRTRRPKEARTHWEVLAWFEGTTWLKLRPETGRTHQIRVHMAAIGHPVVGDPMYGGRGRWKGMRPGKERDVLARVTRQLLHAWKLSFIHPGIMEKMSFTAPLSQDIADVLEEIGLDSSPWRSKQP